MFKRTWIAVLVFTIVLALCTSGCSPAGDKTSGKSQDIKIIELTYSDHDPPGGMRTEFVKNVWIPEIEKQTGGRVKINANFGGSLLSSSEALDGAARGVADMAMIFPDFYPEKLFGYQIFKLFPKSPAKWENISYIYQTALKELPLLQEELKQHNLKPLLITVGLPTVFGATYPIEGVEDIVGKKWRASSRWHLETLKHIGASAVSVPWEDVYVSLQTGVINGVMTNYDGFHMMKFYEPAEHILFAPQLWWASPFLHAINLDTWNSLPQDVQEGILEATEIAQQKFGEVFAGQIEKIIAEQKAAGCDVRIADEDDVALIADEELLSRLRGVWVKEAVSNHGINETEAEGYIEKMKQIMESAIAREQ